MLTHTEIFIPLAGIVDRAAEVDRLGKELASAANEADGLERKLANAGFVERAPAAVVDDARRRLGEVLVRREKLERTLKEIRG